MKKTFPVNINGKVFYIDEDAYDLLQNYLHQLRAAFFGAEGEEIVNDIESRISELFDERISEGASAIVYSDVNRVIEIMGKPADIGDLNEGNTPPPPYDPEKDKTGQKTGEDDKQPRKRLYRNLNNKVLGGVLGGLATYLGWDANIMRLLYVVLTFVTYFWPLTLIYLIAWMVIPAANNPRRILEMQGNPVTVDSIGQEVLSSTPSQSNQDSFNIGNVAENVFSILGKFFMGLLGLVGSAATLVATGFFIFFLTAFIAYTGFGNEILIDTMGWHFGYHSSSMAIIVSCLACMAIPLCFIIPGVALAWSAGSVLFNYRGASKTTVIFAVIFEMLLIVAAIILTIFAIRLA